MESTINCILLIDDDPATNYLHKLIIKDANCAKHVEVALNGKKALEFIIDAEMHLVPDIIFLDVNMPVMDGWSFLEEYEKLAEEKKSRVVIIMLTTSNNPDDMDRAAKCKELSGYCHKPLTVELLQEIISKHFS